jgi:branched-chain amino acid transport system permease protein
VVMAVGVVLFEWARRRFAKKWGQTQEAIEHVIQARAAAHEGAT